MSVVVACKCGGRFQAPPNLFGRQVACPSCGAGIVVPNPAAGSQAAAPQGMAAGPAAAPAANDDFWNELPAPPTYDPTDPFAGPPPQPEDEKKKDEDQEPLGGHMTVAFAINRLQQGYSAAAVQQELASRGVSQGEINRVFETLGGHGGAASLGGASGGGGAGEESGMSAGAKNMMIGLVVCVIGIGVTVGTYMLAEPGGKYMLAYGPVIWGVIQMIRGVIQMATSK